MATTSLEYFSAPELAAFLRLRESCPSALYGGDAYLYAMLASGQVGMVIDTQLKPYDYCALAPVVTGAGGIISDWAGKEVTLQSNGQIIATGGAVLHAHALTMLK
jgi:inositol-phosphate phosphatase/L-galactose 1-phosphate phosphatase/histidinol-phosphatase